ncbi:MAG: hypothetical protein ACQEQY_01890 [Halobacteriota archaeon]
MFGQDLDTDRRPLESDPLCAYVPPDYEGSRPVQTVSKAVE